MTKFITILLFFTTSIYSLFCQNNISGINDFRFESKFEEKAFYSYNQGKSSNYLWFLLATDPLSTPNDLQKYEPILNSFVTDILEKKPKFKNEKKFLGYAYYKAHRKFLKHYKPYSSFKQLFSKGDYDCLTGTAFYSLILEKLGYDYKVVETNYHIFLTINTKEGNYLLESTDPFTGFVSDQNEIYRRIEKYSQGEALQSAASMSTDKVLYPFDFKISKQVGLKELVGLHYYNFAVSQFNSGNMESALFSIEKASFCYHSIRMKEFAKIIMTSITESNRFSQSEKQLFFLKYQKLINRSDMLAYR